MFSILVGVGGKRNELAVLLGVIHTGEGQGAVSGLLHAPGTMLGSGATMMGVTGIFSPCLGWVSKLLGESESSGIRRPSSRYPENVKQAHFIGYLFILGSIILIN